MPWLGFDLIALRDDEAMKGSNIERGTKKQKRLELSFGPGSDACRAREGYNPVYQHIALARRPVKLSTF